MTLPYAWDPGRYTRHVTTRSVPLVDDLVPFEHAVYRVVSVRVTEPDDKGRTVHARVRPVGIAETGDPVADARSTRAFTSGKHGRWTVYASEHYPVCGKCHEPLPCREQMAEQISGKAAEKFERYAVAGVCPGCSEVVTQRQKSVTWEDNAVVPGGPPVTFHLRRGCYHAAVTYERTWVALDPGARKHLYTCGEHHVRDHGNGTYTCTAGADCPGASAQHRSYAVCDCPEHYTGQSRGIDTLRNATRVD